MAAAEAHGISTWLELGPIPDPRFVHVNGSLYVFCFILIVSIIAHLHVKKQLEKYIIPKPGFSLVSMVDVFIEALYNMVISTLGPERKKFFPFIAAIFIFVFFNNLLGLLPMSSAPTANMNTTLALGASTFIYYQMMGFREHGFIGYLKHFLMGLGPAGVLVAMIELVSHAVRPFSLAIRLFVNMHVDHALHHSFSTLVAWIVPVPLLLFGIVICTIQAFVFAILTAVYVEMATEHEH